MYAFAAWYFAVVAKTMGWNWNGEIKLQILTGATADSVDSSPSPAGEPRSSLMHQLQNAPFSD